MQSAKVSVAVIEAGGVYQEEQGNGSWIPALAYSQGTGTDPNEDAVKIDWGFISAPQKVCAFNLFDGARVCLLVFVQKI